jgi:hypothetical protein
MRQTNRRLTRGSTAIDQRQAFYVTTEFGVSLYIGQQIVKLPFQF